MCFAFLRCLESTDIPSRDSIYCLWDDNKMIALLVRSDFDAQVIDLEITKLLSKRVIEPTGHSHREIISDIFLRNKKDGSYWMILNLKKLNQYTSKSTLRWTPSTQSLSSLKKIVIWPPLTLRMHIILCP